MEPHPSTFVVPNLTSFVVGTVMKKMAVGQFAALIANFLNGHLWDRYFRSVLVEVFTIFQVLRFCYLKT